MNDPHVVELRYKFEPEREDDRFDRAPVLSATLGEFDVELKDSVLVAKPRPHFANADDARLALEPGLRAWEAVAFLQKPGLRVRFRYSNTVLEDRRPTPGVVSGSATASARATVRASGVLYHGSYPAPPKGFQVSPLVDELVGRLHELGAGRERLTSTAYYVVTRLKQRYGGLEAAGSALNISSNLLVKLRKLSSTDDPSHGRKAGGHPGPLAREELEWLRKALFRVVLRTGEHVQGGENLARIGVGDI